MGDRSNVWITTYEEPRKGIALYSHWGGYDMPERVRQGLIFGRDRWTDDAYLARILVSKITESDADGTTGSGLSLKIRTSGDGYPVVIVSLDDQMIYFADESDYRRPSEWRVGIPFSVYVKQARSYPNAETEATLARIAALEAELAELRGE